MRHEIYEFDGDTISIPTAESYADCIKLAQSDQYRITGKIISGWVIIFKSIFFPLGARAMLVWFRLASYKSIFRTLFRILHYLACQWLKIDLPINTRIGYGFFIGHGHCIIINERTIMGNNVSISQFDNIGTQIPAGAIIGDGVYIGPTVCIVNDVRIGKNATIGAGAVVTKNIPENATAAGVPAKVLNFNNPGRYATKRWNI